MNIFQKIYKYRELLKTNVKKEIRGRYKNSFLGILWSFLNPLLQLAVYSVIFGALLAGGDKTYHIYICVALIPWTYFTTTITQSAFTIIGNGDIKTREDALRMFEQTNVDGLMIGRGAVGNPWIFEEIINYLQGKEQRKVTNSERLETIIEHINLAVKEKGENIAIKEMRKHLAYYVRKEKDASKIRERINKINDKGELIDCLSEYFKNI